MLQQLDKFRFGMAAAFDGMTNHHAVFVLVTCLTVGVCAAAYLLYSVKIVGSRE